MNNIGVPGKQKYLEGKGMLVSNNWKDLISTLGTIQIAIGITGGGLWLLFRNKSFIQLVTSKDNPA